MRTRPWEDRTSFSILGQRRKDGWATGLHSSPRGQTTPWSEHRNRRPGSASPPPCPHRRGCPRLIQAGLHRHQRSVSASCTSAPIPSLSPTRAHRHRRSALALLRTLWFSSARRVFPSSQAQHRKDEGDPSGLLRHPSVPRGHSTSVSLSRTTGHPGTRPLGSRRPSPAFQPLWSSAAPPTPQRGQPHCGSWH